MLAYSSHENSTDTDVAFISDNIAEISIPSSSTTSPAKNYPHLKKSGTAGFLQAGILQCGKLASLAARIKMTPAQQRIYTKAVVEKSGGDSSKLNISYSYVDKSRRKFVQNIASTTKEHWILPTISSLHWYFKILPMLKKSNVSDEQLTVITGTQQETKLLGSLTCQLS